MTSSKKMIMAAGITVAVVISLILYAPTIAANNPEEDTLQDDTLQSIEPQYLCMGRRRFRCCPNWLWILKRSEPVAIDGTVVGLFKGMLVLNVEDGQVRVLLPRVWTIETEIVRRNGIFDTGFVAVGEEITVKALKFNLIEEENYSVNFLFGYEMINATGMHAYALLPFNIED